MPSQMLPAPQYTLHDAIGVLLAWCHRLHGEVRAIERLPGLQGEAGPRGERGEKGEKGERGAKGEPGRNATDLTLIEERIEQRVERAIEAITFTSPDGGRTLRFALGDKLVREVKTAIVLDVGVWKEGANYAAGDGVTSGGSFFIAQRDTTARPGKSDDWRLAVKRGSDGRDYRPEEKRAPEPVRFR